MPDACILGLGTAVPTHQIDQADAAEAAKALCCTEPAHVQALPILFRRTRIARRGSVLLERATGQRQRFFAPPTHSTDHGPTTGQRMDRYAREALPLAVRASSEALARSGLTSRAITHLITVSCTGFAAPGIDIGLVRALRLPRGVPRTHIGFMGCHGAFNALRLSQSLVAGGPVMICAAELCSLHFQYGWATDQVVANALFADGAAALVLSREAREASAWRLSATGSTLLPGSADHITWRVGDAGFQMRLSAELPGLLRRALPRWVRAWLRGHGLRLEDVPSWAVHPGGPRLLNAAVECLGLSAPQAATSWAVLADHGNMSSPTTLFILERLRRAEAARPCVALAFGPGVTVEAALFR